MLIVYVCQEFKWDYETYMRQPSWFLDLVHKKIEIDGKKANAEASSVKMKPK